MNESDEILRILDDCAESFRFPVLDNGYIYLAATRLSLFRSDADWAIVIEVFGFSPRAGLPDVSVQTFASRLHDRDPPQNYVNREAHTRYLQNNPHNEFRSFSPISEGTWQDETYEFVADDATEVVLRGKPFAVPSLDAYTQQGIVLEQAPRVQVFELCRLLAAVERDLVLATEWERRVSVLPGMAQLMQLDEWNHPDVVGRDRPSESETFQQLARVLTMGETKAYNPTSSPNTDWRNWPEGGRL